MDDLTVKQAAAELGIPARTILHRLKTGKMRGQQLAGWQWVIPREEVERWRGQPRIKPGWNQGSDDRHDS
jgi:excisionase family DNA binding protein